MRTTRTAQAHDDETNLTAAGAPHTWPRRRATQASSPLAAAPHGTLLVPVRETAPGVRTVRLFRNPLGERVAVGFTTIARLRGVCGPEQAWMCLSEECLRETIAGLGARTVVRDPRLAARAA